MPRGRVIEKRSDLNLNQTFTLIVATLSTLKENILEKLLSLL